MSKEKEIQDEFERYWGQLDRIEQAIVKNKNRIGAVGGQLDRLEKSLIFLRNQIKRFDKVERMLKWLVVRKELDYLSHDLEHNEYRDEYRKPILDDMFKLSKSLPNMSDILDDVEKK